MAAASPPCRVCNHLLSPKRRRSIFGNTFGVISQLTEVLGYTPSSSDCLSKYVCDYCFVRLSKLAKVDYDIEHYLDALKKKRLSLINDLRSRSQQESGPTLRSLQSVANSYGTVQTGQPCPTVLKPEVIEKSSNCRRVRKSRKFHSTVYKKIAPKQQTDTTIIEPEKSTKVVEVKVNFTLFSPDQIKEELN
ncbi:uncharacterized protein LOC133206347 [Saccostrea echinata]|uniref:uncharacterized protein LOC133206347 n=1 Tax=Saccostrea echinata TaxID=191078 RepID=UPI002A7EAF5F|nr:uncharacterized protein LOC133206347 [Saccostrea echinata]